MNTPIVSVNHLSYRFGDQLILNDISLDIAAGSVFGFLGPNGAGKTTTLRLLLGLLKTGDSSIRLFDSDINTNRVSILKRVGALIEQPSLYMHLSGRENLEIFRLAYDCPKSRIDEVLAMVDLRDAGNKKAKSYSLGMKQRLAIAIAMLHNPDLLILDEPTNGLDPNGIIAMRELIRSLHTVHGKTIIISSHLLSEVEKMATDVGIIHKGKMLFCGGLQELQEIQSNKTTIEIEVDNVAKAAALLSDRFAVTHVNGSIWVEYESPLVTAQLNTLLVANNIAVYKLCPVKSDLENLFNQIVKE